jgi:hypothetical protein
LGNAASGCYLYAPFLNTLQGVFYYDINGEGQSQNFTWFSTGEFDGQNGALPNDKLSSIKIDTSAPGF